MAQHLHHRVHLLHAGQLQRAVEIVAAGAQVRTGQAHIGQPRPVGAPPDGLHRRGEPRQLRRPLGIVHQMHTVRELLLHVVVAVLQGELHPGGGVGRPHLGGGALHQRLFLLKLGPVVVPDDILHVGRGGGARQGVQVKEALVPIRLAGDGRPGQQGVELLGDEQGVFHHALGGARVDGHAGDIHLGAGGVEVLVLDGPRRGAVYRVGVPGPEGRHVEVVGALADLLVGGTAPPRSRAGRQSRPRPWRAGRPAPPVPRTSARRGFPRPAPPTKFAPAKRRRRGTGGAPPHRAPPPPGGR